MVRTKRSALPRSFLACLLLLLLSAPTTSTSQPPTGSAEADLVRWLTTRGALLGGEVRAPADGPRGLFAARDHAAGETLGFVPFAAAVPVGRTGEPGLVAALARRAYDPHSPFFVNGSWAPFWRTQPPLADMLCGETISDALLAQLEAPAMEAAVREARAAHLADYTELQAELAAEQGLPAPALAEEEGQEQGSLPLLLSFGQYMHLAALTTTRAFAFHDEDGTCCTDWLLPGFDLLNTAPAGLLNAVRRHNDDDDVGGAWRVELRASRAVRAGEELLWVYFDAPPVRADAQLLRYGFFMRDNDEPEAGDEATAPEGGRLLALDCPNWTADDPFDDAGLLGGGGGGGGDAGGGERGERGCDAPPASLPRAAAAAELARLEALLAGAAPLAGDRARLAAAAAPGGGGGGGPAFWSPEGLVLRVRVRRKRALAGRAAALRARLGAGGGGGDTDEL